MGDFEAGPVDAFLEAFAAKFPGDPLHPDRFHALPDWADCLLSITAKAPCRPSTPSVSG